MLVNNISPDSALYRLVRKRRRALGVEDTVNIEDAPADVWSQTDWLLVSVHDQIQMLLHAYLQAHSKRRLPVPKLMPRPGAEPVRRQTLNAWFGAVGLPPVKAPVPTT